MAAGKVVAIGVVQEQHPDRARLYRQWRKLDWPILVDSLNLLDLAAVPVPMGIDESGIVRVTRPRPRTFVRDFIERDFERTPVAKSFHRAREKDLDPGAREFLFGNPAEAVALFEKAVKKNPGSGRAHFRLGTVLRRRADSSGRMPGDGQRSVEEWGAALSRNPNQYIWRRRIQQYGPRLDKPYNFYSWVARARREIRARGEKPVELAAEPGGAEIQSPKRRASGERPGIPDPDPKGRILRDKDRLVRIETMVTPARVRPGHRIRVRATFRVDAGTRPWWNNEASILTLCPEFPGAVTPEEGRFEVPPPKEAETREVRVLEFEARIAEDAKSGKVTIPAYALYGVCEDAGGVCMFLRQDLKFTFRIDPTAPKIR